MKDATIIGNAGEFVEVLKDYKVELVAAGVAVDTLVLDLETKTAGAAKKDAAAEGLKTQLKDSTEVANEAMADLSEFLSDKVDVVAGAVGKKKNHGMQILKLRSSVRNRPATGDSEDESKAA
jgi:intracellular sulfur oxidation DsrE/DsrF family protein